MSTRSTDYPTYAVRLQTAGLRTIEKRDLNKVYHNQYDFEKWQEGRTDVLKNRRSVARSKKKFLSHKGKPVLK